MTEAVTVIRTFDAPRELVWEALTAREHFATWFGTEAVDVPLDTLVWEPAVGARWSAVMRLPDGSTKDWLGEFIQIDAPSHFVFALTDQPENPADLSPVTIDLVEVDGGTEVTLVQQTPGWGEAERAGLTAGYNAFLDSVGTIVDGIR